MPRRKRTPEEIVRKEHTKALMKELDIKDMDDIQDLFKSFVAAALEGGLEADKDKFGDDIFAQAKTAVNDDLGEKSLKKSLMKQIQRSQKQQRSVDNKCRNHEFEQ